MSQIKTINSKVNISKITIYIILSAWAITTVAPLIWVMMNSLKSTSDILSNSLKLPFSLDLTNFHALSKYASVNIPRGFLNSIIISGSVVFLVLVLGGMAAFVIGRFEFTLNGPIKVILVASMLVPPFAVIVPTVQILRFFHINDSYFAVIIPHTAGFLNFAIIMIAGFMKSLPIELEEAAIIDGCGIPRIFLQITLPLSTPIFATTGIMIFLWSYNDILLPLVYLKSKMLPISVLITQVSSMYATDYGAMMAALTITIIPVIIFYAISQKWVIKGMTAGAVKG